MVVPCEVTVAAPFDVEVLPVERGRNSALQPLGVAGVPVPVQREVHRPP